ncbi:MAG TPA: hypothetical protein VI385_03950 [Flavisolibacter sp.]
MKGLLVCLVFFCLSISSHARGTAFLIDSVPKRTTGVSHNGGKLYCSDYAKTRYKLSISGTSVKITRMYKEYVESFTGVIRHGKIYSNNPDEKNLKGLEGRYYKLEGNNFGVLNIENGDYEWFAECKQK